MIEGPETEPAPTGSPPSSPEVPAAEHAVKPAPPVKMPVNPAALAASLRAQTPAVYAGSTEDSLPRLYDLDRDAYNAPVADGEAVAVGIEYARRWASAVGSDALDLIRDRYDPGFDGNIPRQIDSDLLYFGSDHGLDTYATPKKFALRHGFWQGILGE